MPILLDPTKDVPQNALATSQLFQELAKEFTEEELKKDIFKDKEEDAKVVVESLKKLASLKINPKGVGIKISEYWENAFKGHEDQGRKLFEKIQDKLQKVEAATKQDGVKKQEIDKKILAASTTLLNELNAVLAAWGTVNTEVGTADQAIAAAPPAGAAQPAAPPVAAPGTKEALIAEINKLVNDPAAQSLGLFTVGNTKVNNLTVAELNTVKNRLNNALRNRDPAKRTTAQNILKAAGLGPSTLNRLTENNTSKKLKQSKQLYKLGLITENEYLAELVKIKKLLKEATPAPASPVATPTGTPPVPGAAPVVGTPPAGTPDPAKDKLGGLLAALSQDKGFMKSDYFKLVSEIHAAAQKESTTPIVSEVTRRLIKAKIKQRLLTEASDENGLLNELAILSAIKGVLGAVIGWIAGKFSNWFKGGPAAVHVVPTGYNPDGNSQQIIQALTEQIAALETARQTPNGATLDQNNKPVNPNVGVTAIENAKKALESNKVKYETLLNEAKGLVAPITTAYSAHPKVSTALNAAIGIAAPNPAVLEGALTEKETYFKSV